MHFYSKILTAFAVAAALGAASSATAATYGFDHIVESGDGASELADGAIGEAQLAVDVLDASSSSACVTGNCVSFTFTNTGPDAASIVQIYWDDNANPAVLNAIIDISSSAGVAFSEGASPPDLPGGNNVGFVADASADADSGQGPGGKALNGVNPGESVTIVFSLQGAMTSDEVIAAMNAGELIIGVHVQAYASGGSESFVSSGECIQGSFDCPTNVTGTIPLPASLPLLAFGVAGLGFLSRRRRKLS